MPREESGPHGGAAQQVGPPASAAANDARPQTDRGPSVYDADLTEVWIIDDLPPLTHRERSVS